MSDLDPEDTAPSPAGPEDTQSSDQSKSGLRKAWDAWTNRPENNAALLQFGLAMLQPRAPGQSGVGQFANAVGQGAEASDRNVASQEAAAKQASDIEGKRVENAARTTTAQAYADQVKQGGSKGVSGALQLQKLGVTAYNKWLNTPEDVTGMTKDGILGAVQQKFPDVKSKSDLLANPAAAAVAKRYFIQQQAEENPDEAATPQAATGAPAAAPATTAPPPGTPRPVWDKQGKKYMWDGVAGHAPVPVGG